MRVLIPEASGGYLELILELPGSLAEGETVTQTMEVAMKWWQLMIVLGVITNVATAGEVITNDALAAARRAFARAYHPCGNSYVSIFISEGPDGMSYSIAELRGVQIIPEQQTTSADRMNGLAWKGTVHIKAQVYRTYTSSKAQWSPWNDIRPSYNYTSLELTKRSGADEWIDTKGGQRAWAMGYHQPNCDRVADLPPKITDLDREASARVREFLGLNFRQCGDWYYSHGSMYLLRYTGVKFQVHSYFVPLDAPYRGREWDGKIEVSAEEIYGYPDPVPQSPRWQGGPRRWNRIGAPPSGFPFLHIRAEKSGGQWHLHKKDVLGYTSHPVKCDKLPQ